jgi:DNA helicase IV
MELATKVMMAATPDLRSPTAVRADGEPPEIRSVDGDGLGPTAAAAVTELRDALGDGSVAVVVPDDLAESIADALNAAGIVHGRATRGGLADDVTVVPVSVVKGLELDGVVVVEPSHIVDAEAQGLRALYVALTRATKRLIVVHHDGLPAAMV